MHDPPWRMLSLRDFVLPYTILQRVENQRVTLCPESVSEFSARLLPNTLHLRWAGPARYLQVVMWAENGGCLQADAHFIVGRYR